MSATTVSFWPRSHYHFPLLTYPRCHHLSSAFESSPFKHALACKLDCRACLPSSFNLSPHCSLDTCVCVYAYTSKTYITHIPVIPGQGRRKKHSTDLPTYIGPPSSSSSFSINNSTLVQSNAHFFPKPSLDSLLPSFPPYKTKQSHPPYILPNTTQHNIQTRKKEKPRKKKPSNH